MVRAAKLAAILICMALVCPAAMARSAPQARIAFVIDASHAMGESWLGTTRLAACLEAVTTELKSLPLRAKAAIWLATADGPELLAAPAEADKLNTVRMHATARGERPPIAPNLAPALRWAADGQPGAVIVVGLPLGGDVMQAPGGGPFVHGLIAGPITNDRGMQAPLTLQSGGRMLSETDPARLQAALHSLVRLGLSRASLYADVRGADNKPLSVELSIASSNGKGNARPVMSNTTAQVLPNTYTVTWPTDTEIGPGTPPGLVRVGDAGQTILRAGGQGKLFVEAIDATGKALAWKITISTVPAGKVLANKTVLPFEADLPAGSLLVSVAKPPVSWSVDLAAGQTQHLVLGPRGSLTANLAGPGGPVRLPVTAIGPDASTRQWRGHTGSPLPLPPGSYRLTIQTMPPVERPCQIAPGVEQPIDLPAVGGLLIETVGTATPQRYDVIDDKDQNLGYGHTGRTLWLLPGRYVAVLPGGKSLAAEISPQRLTTLEAK